MLRGATRSPPFSTCWCWHARCAEHAPSEGRPAGQKTALRARRGLPSAPAATGHAPRLGQRQSAAAPGAQTLPASGFVQPPSRQAPVSRSPN
eukprot:8130351-Lingulodinium_polyedra.AAC.1